MQFLGQSLNPVCFGKQKYPFKPIFDGIIANLKLKVHFFFDIFRYSVELGN